MRRTRKDGITGGVFVPNKISKMTEEQLLTHVKTSKIRAFYLRRTAWNKAGSITNAEAWRKYLTYFRMEKLTPLQITIQ
jgi:hypothetical protein